MVWLGVVRHGAARDASGLVLLFLATHSIVQYSTVYYSISISISIQRISISVSVSISIHYRETIHPRGTQCTPIHPNKNSPIKNLRGSVRDGNFKSQIYSKV